MSVYLKISYKTKSENIALKECIMHIGKLYGNNRYNSLYKAGKALIAKKVPGATKTSINYMVYPKKIKNKDMKQWRFKKRSYERTYRYIIYIMLHKSENKEESLSLLHNLYLELLQTNKTLSKTLSNILVSEQKDILLFALDKPQYKRWQEQIDNILNEYKECDKNYNILKG